MSRYRFIPRYTFQKLTLSQLPRTIFNRNALNIVLVAAVSLNIVSIGIPGLIAQYNDAQARVPHPLVSDQQLANAPAADAGPAGRNAVTLSDPVKKGLADQLKKEQDGKAKNRTHVKALDEGRTATDRVYLNADGTKSVVRSLQATSFKDSNGNWQDVDTSLIQDMTSSKWHTKANSWDTSFGDISSDGIQVSLGNQNFTFKPVGGKSAKPAVTGAAPNQVVTYKNVWQGVDLQYKVSGFELKESIIIKSKVAQTGFDFAATGANLTSDPAKPGAFLLDGAFAGFSIAAATVSTSDGSSVGNLPNVDQTASNGQIRVSLDATWLKNQANASYPVIIDPTVYGPSAPADYYDFSSTGTNCHGSVACGGQAVGNQGSTTNWRSAIQANLSSIPAGEFPLAASLHLEVKSGSTASSSVTVDHSTCQTAFACYDTAWGSSSGSVSSAADLDITNVMMGAMWVPGNTMPWFMIHGNETTGSNSYKLFDDTKTAITITYEALPSQSTTAVGSPADGGIAITTQPTLFANTSTDSDGPGPLLYRFVLGTSKSVPAYNPYNLIPSVGGLIANSGQSASTQWTVPDNVLQDGTTYYWQVTAWDSLSGAPEVYGPTYSFKVDLRQGKDATQSLDTAGSVKVDLATGNLESNAQTHAISALGGSLGVNLDYNSPQVSRQGLIGSYYNYVGSPTFPSSSTAPTLQRVDPNVNFNWGTGSPATGIIGNDNFLVRWDGYFVAPQNGTYQFGTTSDDGSRIFLNANYSTAYLDQWSTLPSNVFGGTTTLTTGQIVPVRYEYYENTGLANAQLLVKTADGTINGVAQPAWLQTGVRPVSTPHGLVGRYYTDDGSHNFPAQDDPTRLFLTRTDTSLYQNWGTGSPLPNGPSTSFMVRWVGSYTPAVSGIYNFKATVSDGVRVTVGSTQVINAWSDHEPAASVGPTAPVTLTGGTPVPITVDYYQNTATDQISVLVNRPDFGTGVYQPIDTTSLSPQAQVLPDGWGLGIDADSNLAYDYATIGLNDVTLRDSTGQTHEYKFVNGGFTPPAGEDGHMLRNGDGTVTFQDSDGRTYVFNPNGTLKSSSTATDDLHPAALQYIYGGSPAHLTQISDAVTQTNPSDPSTAARWLKVLYAGDSNCPSVPTGFISYSSAAGMICAIYTSDGTQTLPVSVANGNVTRFLYTTVTHPDGTTAPFLARIEKPGSDFTDYGFDTLGRIVQIRDTLANDAVTAGVRTQDGTETTQIAYDALGHASSVTLPAATPSASRLAHTYNYYQGYTYQHLTGATEPNGFTRKVLYDGTYRTTDDYDIANLDSKTQWDPAKDLVLSTTDPVGLMSTTLYDYDNRPTDQYGPAPSTWYNSATRTPLTTPTDYTPQIPHKQTAYDGAINGLAAVFYNVDSYTNGTGQPTKALFGNPALHTTGIGPSNGDVNKTWGGTPPFTPASGKGWGTRLSGFIHLASTGTYTFRIQSDDGVRLWVDDTLVIDDWNDGVNRSHGMISGYPGFNNTSDSTHRIRLEYYNKAVGGVLDTDATLTLLMTPPGGSETSSLGSLLNPGYGLKTSQTSYDSSSSVGNTNTVTGYGANPELGLPQTSTVDPTGLNLTTTSTYETQGATGSYLRQTAKYLPGANTAVASTGTQYTYYGATDTLDNPCTVPVETYKQAGRLHITTDPDPDGAGMQTPVSTETIYDDAGRVVATRYNSEAWKCTTYDARGRITLDVTPSQPNTAHVTRSARTVTNNWAVSGNPLVTSIGDDQGTITTTSDLLGRTIGYTDAKGNSTSYTFDAIGRPLSKVSPIGTEGYVFDNTNRLTAQKLGTTTLASPTYDSYGRLSNVNYPTASITSPVTNTLNLAISRDTLGRINNYDYSAVDPYTATVKHVIDNTNLSQSNQVVSGTEAGAAKTYSYDKADRLTSATLGTHSFSYNFSTPTTCTGTYNANANKNANRTTQTVDGVTTTSCYDYADRLVSDAVGSGFVGTQQYDAHGNMSAATFDGSNRISGLEYDSSDRIAYTHDSGGGANLITHDAQDRLLHITDYGWKDFGYTGPGDSPDFSRGSTGFVQETYIQLPGGVTLTDTVNLSGGVTGQVYSLPNQHGDIFATTDGTSVLTGGVAPNNGIFQYEPFGKVLGTSATIPNNAVGSSKIATLGQYSKLTETGNQAQFVFMGARLYDPTSGRFTQVDPVEGASENNYIYPSDPVNKNDVSGQCPMCLLALPILYEALNLFSEDPASVSSEARYTVYLGYDSKRVVKYVGITKRNPLLRWAEHKGSKSPRANLKFEYRAQNLTRQQARKLEQQYIDRYGLGRNGGALYNKINSIRR